MKKEITWEEAKYITSEIFEKADTRISDTIKEMNPGEVTDENKFPRDYLRKTRTLLRNTKKRSDETRTQLRNAANMERDQTKIKF